jgi:hypothetical protein
MFVEILEEAARKGLEQKKMKKGGKVKKKPIKKAHRGDGIVKKGFTKGRII